MPDIKNSIKYELASKSIISAKCSLPSFCHSSWSDDDLKSLRKTIRDYYRKEQNGLCCYCKGKLSLRSANNCYIEHIVPKSIYLDFIFTEKNLCVVCADCNEIKRDQETTNSVKDTLVNGKRRRLYPRSSGAFKIVHPHFDDYEDHILVLEGSYYLDKTKKGHFTIGACNLNRRLREFGWEKSSYEDFDINNIMNSFLNETNILKQTKLLKKLKEKLILL